jgi:hypothetical protein
MLPRVPSSFAIQEVPSDPTEAMDAASGIMDSLNNNAKGLVSFLVSELNQITLLKWSELTFHVFTCVRGMVVI